MKYKRKVQVKSTEYICLVTCIDRDGVVARNELEQELIRCKDCKYFESDHIEPVGKTALIVAHEICTKWGCRKTNENGYCHMAERKSE